MANLTNRIEQHLKKEHEGDVFAHVYLQCAFGEFYVSRDYYTVKNGKVCIIENQQLIPTNDTISQTKTDCIKVGKYNPKNKYKRTHRGHSYKEIKKILNL